MFKINPQQQFMTLIFLIIFLIGLIISYEGDGITITAIISWAFTYMLLYIVFTKPEK